MFRAYPDIKIKKRLSSGIASTRRLSLMVVVLMTVAVATAAVSEDSKSKRVDALKESNEFVVVLDAGHGGKDIGATDNGAREKDINLAVALKVGELIKKKLKNTKVVFTRDDDTFVSLQGRADIANKAKADLFVSIHTNSVDKSNKNRKTVNGTSVYALGLHKDDNNMNVARRENSVIELEGDYEGKYQGFDPNKDESYIIFEMAQKKNLAQSIRFANEVQKNMVDIADRRDRGVHQAGFWVLWATSMPSVLIELDFICNPESAAFMTSSKGVGKMADAIFEAIKTYEEKYVSRKGLKAGVSRPVRKDRSVDEILSEARESGEIPKADVKTDDNVVARAGTSTRNNKDRSHVQAADVSASSRRSSTRRRRSRKDAAAESNRDYRQGEIIILTESDGVYYSEIDAEKLASNSVKTQSSESNKTIDKNKNKKTKKNDRKSNSKTEKNSDRQKRKFVTVYTIQIAASEDKLKGGSSEFHGLSPIYAFRENNMYKYTYGESKTREGIEPLLRQVQEMIPDAFVIKKTRSM